MERGTDRIRLESSAHGQYECEARDLDLIMEAYHQHTVPQLQGIIEREQGLELGSYTITSRTEAYMILAELRGYATN